MAEAVDDLGEDIYLYIFLFSGDVQPFNKHIWKTLLSCY